MLPDHLLNELKALKKALLAENRFNLIVAEYNSFDVQKQIIEELSKLNKTNCVFDIAKNNCADLAAFETALAAHAGTSNVVHIINLHHSRSNEERIEFTQLLNNHRERIAQLAPANIVFWILEMYVKDFIIHAPDFWAWKTTLISFATPIESGNLHFSVLSPDITALDTVNVRARIKNLIEELKKPARKLKPNDTLFQELVSFLKKIRQYRDAIGYLDNELKQFVTEVECIVKRLAKKQNIEPKDLATSYNNLSQIYSALGDLQKALEFQLKDVEISEKVLDAKHPDLAASYNNISQIYLALGDLQKALEFQLKAIEICEKVLDTNHPNLATSYNNISLIYSDLGDLQKALEFQLKDVEISEKVLDTNHPNLAASYNNLAALYHKLNEKKQAQSYIEHAIEILEYNFPKGHPDLEKARERKKMIDQ